MMKINTSLVTKLRELTGAGVIECRNALIESGGDIETAEKTIRDRGIFLATKRESRETKQGLVVSYTHVNGSVSSIVELNCETDFVARTEEFKNLAHELALQVAAMNPGSVEDLLEQEYIRDPSKKIKEKVFELCAKTGENIKVSFISRHALGEE